MKIYPESEVRATWDHVLATREKIGRGEADWGDIADHFTEEAVYIDAVWGRYVGREAIRTFMHDCMVGFEDWRFPTLWTLVKDNLVVNAFWSRVPGRKPNGDHADCLCFSVAIYAGDGLFCYETDVFNMAELGALVEEVGWTPPANSRPVPEKPDRNQLPPDRPGIGHWGLAV